MSSIRPWLIAGLIGSIGIAAVLLLTRKASPGGIFDTEEYRIRTVPVVRGLDHPWSLAFLPDGDTLVTERPGKLRLIHDGILQTISGIPAVNSTSQEGLLDLALHPQFEKNHLVYFTYSKPGALSTAALGRGRLEGTILADVRELFVSDAASPEEGNLGSRIVFLRDGTLLMTVGERHEKHPSQAPSTHKGKILRLRDDGSVPPDNPFLGKPDFKREIYTLGHRNPQGLTLDPLTGAILETEHGPMGGDELNHILPGRNYGWPLVTYGVNYDGSMITTERTRPDMENPLRYWVPSIGPSGLTLYTGTRFPKWQGNVFVGAMADRSVGRQLYRLSLNTKPQHQEAMLAGLEKRIRDVRQGPDGFLYLLTDESSSALLRLEPVP